MQVSFDYDRLLYPHGQEKSSDLKGCEPDDCGASHGEEEDNEKDEHVYGHWTGSCIISGGACEHGPERNQDGDESGSREEESSIDEGRGYGESGDEAVIGCRRFLEKRGEVQDEYQGQCGGNKEEEVEEDEDVGITRERVELHSA